MSSFGLFENLSDLFIAYITYLFFHWKPHDEMILRYVCLKFSDAWFKRRLILAHQL